MEAATAEVPPVVTEAQVVATAPPVHADDSGDRPLGDFGKSDPNEIIEADIKAPKSPPQKREIPKTSNEPPIDPTRNLKKPEEAKPEAVEKPAESGEPNYDKMAPKELRDAVKRFHKTNRDLEKQVAEFKAKPATPPDESKVKAYEEKLTAAEKRNAELMEDLKYADFEKHPDYAEKYEKPFVSAYNAGRAHVAKISVNMPDGNTRRGTAEDFDSIAKLAQMDYDAAATKAEEMFGPVKAATVLQHLNRAQELNDARFAAAAEYKTKGNERDKARMEEQTRFQEKVSKEVDQLWTTQMKEDTEAFKQWAAPVEGDEEGNKLLEAGYEDAKKAFFSFDVMNPKRSKAEREDLVKRHVAMFNKAAWFNRLEHQWQTRGKEIEALKKKLSEYEASTPAGGNGARGGAAAVAEEDGGIAEFLKTKGRR